MSERITPLQLRLYVAGNAPNSLQARRNLEAVLADSSAESYDVEVIDCLTEPARTLADGIVVTPTLKKLAPDPECTIIGTLADHQSVRNLIGIGDDE